MATYANGLIEWGGNAGQPVYVRQPDGSMKNVGAPEHGESASYVARAVSDPQVEKVIALYNAAPEMLNNEQKAFISAGMGGLDSFGQGYRWGSQNLFDNVFNPQQAGHLLQSGFANYLSPADVASGQQFNFEQSAAQQSARDDDGGMFGDIAPLLLAGAGLYFGLPALSEALGGAGGLFGAEAAAGGLAGAEAASLGSLGSGLAGVDIAGLGLYGQTPLMAGTLGSGLAGTTAASIGLDAGMLGMLGGVAGVAEMSAAGMTPSQMAQVAQTVANSGGAVTPSQAASGLFGIEGLTVGGALGAGASILGGILSGQANSDAAQTSANAQLEAARIAAEAAKFRPVGVSTRFGDAQWVRDAQGNVTSVNYGLKPDIKAQQDSLIAGANQMLPQYQGSLAATQPMSDASQRMMSLGNQYLATDPQAQAAKYLSEQQALLAPYRERERLALENRLLSQGRLGLATGGTSTGLQAANPEMEALRNAQMMQDLGLAAQATQGGMDYAKFGSALVGSGGDMLKNMYGTQAASLQPWQAGMQGAQYLEGLGQQPVTMGADLSKVTSNAAAGNLLAQGMLGAAQTRQAAAYSPFGTALMAGGNALRGMMQPTAQGVQQVAPQQGMVSTAQDPFYGVQMPSGFSDWSYNGSWY